MADRSISISLEAKVGGFVAGMKTAQQATNDFANRTAAFAKANDQHFDRLGKASMVMGGAVVAGVGLAVKTFMDFDKAMSEVRASTHETAANMDLLRTAAINAGADTAFSAQEAAKGIDELAKAGVSTKEILNGGLTGALSLAAAGSLGVGDSAEIAATALTQFKLAGKDIPHVADLLAAGAGKAQGSVGDMGAALKQSGLVASQFGLSIEDTTGTLAAFASAGLVGSDSGTSLKTMLLKLASPSKEAAGMMQDLGIAAYDSTGKFVGVTDLAGQLKDKLGGLTQAQRDSTLATIFGTDAIRGANVLYEQGAKGIDGWIGKVNEAGYAAVTASIKQDNLAGDIEKLGGSFDSVLIKGGSGVADALRGLVQGAEDMVDAFGKIPTPILNAGLGMAGMAGAAALVGGAVITAVPKFVEFKDSMEKIAPAGTKAGDGIRKVGKAAGVAVGALVALQVAAAVFTEKNTKSVEDYGQALLKVGKAGNDAKGFDSIMGGFDKVNGIAVSNVDNMADAVKRLTNQNFNDIGNKFFEPFTSFLGLPKGEIGQLQDRLKGLGDEMGNLTKNGAADTAAKSFQVLTKEFEKNGKGAQEALDAVPGYKDALLSLANQAGVTVEGQDLLDFAMGKIPASMQGATDATETYKSAAGETKPVSEELATALAEIGVSAQGAATDLDKFTQALFDSGLRTMDARDATFAHDEAIRKTSDAVIAAKKAIEDKLVADGYGAEAAKAMADQQYNLGAALNKSKTDFDSNTAAGKVLNDQFQAVAKTGMAEIQAKAKEGAGMPELQANLTATFNELKKTGEGMGLTAGGAEALARKILGIPKTANIKTWMSDAAKKMAEQTAGALDKIDGKTVHTYAIHHDTTIITQQRSDSIAPTRGTADRRVAAHATGGAIVGPGTGTSDDIPALLSNGEHVLTAAEVARMGGQAAVYRFRQMLDGGKLPKFAVGGAVAARRSAAADLLRDSRRGAGYRSVAGGVSNAYSYADKLTSLADSGNVSAAAVRNLYAAAGKGEAGLRSLYSRSDRLAKSLETAKKRMEDLASVRSSVASKLSGEFSIGDAAKRGFSYGKDSMQSIQGSASRFLAKVQGFAGKLKSLQKRGYSGAIIQEIADMGVADGSMAADALLQAKPGEVKKLNDTYKAIGSASSLAGTYVTDSMFKGGLNAATGLVKGLQSQQGAIDKQMQRIGLSMENALRSAVGLKPLKKAGGGRVYGPGTETSDSVPHMLSKDEYVIQAKAAKAIGYAELDRMNAGQMKPAITYRPAARGGSSAGSRDVHVHLEAKAGLAHEYASDMARQTTIRLKDALHSINI